MAWAKGNNAMGRSARQGILARDNRTCYLCAGEASQVDHIKPKYLGGTNDPENLAAICLSCHKIKSSREGHAAKALRKATKPLVHPGLRA